MRVASGDGNAADAEKTYAVGTADAEQLATEASELAEEAEQLAADAGQIVAGEPQAGKQRRADVTLELSDREADALLLDIERVAAQPRQGWAQWLKGNRGGGAAPTDDEFAFPAIRELYCALGGDDTDTINGGIH